MEDFATGSAGLNASAHTGSFSFNDITYSVDGAGEIGIFNMTDFMASTYSSVSGLGIIGDYQWHGDTTSNVHNFTMFSNGGVKFRLASVDAITGNGGPPTVFTITAYSGATQMAQVTDVDLATLAATGYASLTNNAVSANYIGPGDEPATGFGQHLVFSGIGWQSVDKIVFTSTGNDLLLGLDNIQFANPIPEPSAMLLSVLGVAGALGVTDAVAE